MVAAVRPASSLLESSSTNIFLSSQTDDHLPRNHGIKQMTTRLLSPALFTLLLTAALIPLNTAPAEAQATPAPATAVDSTLLPLTPQATATITLDDNNPKQTITVAPDTAVTVALKTAPLASYQWAVTWIDGPCKNGENDCWDRFYHPIKPEFSAQLGYAVATVLVPSHMRVVFGYFPPVAAGGNSTTGGATATKVFEVTVEVTGTAPPAK
jgi:hypothetical protein